MAPATVLISGLGIAGPALAHWLGRHGHRPILVERTGGLRTGGHAVDDFCFDEMSQVEMASWSAGRVALLGDAEFGPSRAVALPHAP